MQDTSKPDNLQQLLLSNTQSNNMWHKTQMSTQNSQSGVDVCSRWVGRGGVRAGQSGNVSVWRKLTLHGSCMCMERGGGERGRHASYTTLRCRHKCHMTVTWLLHLGRRSGHEVSWHQQEFWVWCIYIHTSTGYTFKVEAALCYIRNLSQASDCIVSYPSHISIPSLISEGTSPHHCEEPVNVKVGVCITSVCKGGRYSFFSIPTN